MRKPSAILLSFALLVLPSIASAQSANGVSSISTSDAPAAPIRQTGESRTLSGMILTREDALVPNVSVIVRTAAGAELRTASDQKFRADHTPSRSERRRDARAERILSRHESQSLC